LLLLPLFVIPAKAGIQALIARALSQAATQLTVIPAKAGTHFAFAFARDRNSRDGVRLQEQSRITKLPRAARQQRQNGFQLSLE